MESMFRTKFVNVIFLLSFIFSLASCSTSDILSSHSETKLYMINIYGGWCKTCSRVEPAIKKIQQQIKNTAGLKYLVFDQTNPETLLGSEKLSVKYGLEEIFEVERHTGEVIFVDAKTKEVLTRFYGVDDSNIYWAAIRKLMSGESFESITAERKEYILSKPALAEIQQAKLYVVDIHHDMCGGCAITAPVFEEVALEYKNDLDVSFFTFDLTSPETVKETSKLAEDLGIYQIYKSHKHTGEVLFIDAKSTQILKAIALEKNKQVYHDIIAELL